MEILLLNTDYTFLNTISIKRAFNKIENGKVEIVAYSDEVIHTPCEEKKIPAVLRLINMITRLYTKGVSYKKKNIFIRDNYTCQYCGKKNLTGIDCTRDHVFPQSRGGKDKFTNVVTCCKSCNSYKGDRTLQECGMMFIKQGWKPYTPTFAEHLSKKMDDKQITKRLQEYGVF